jgi:protein-tyrosine phosphatase
VLDFHSHLIPGVDDGSKSVEDSLVAVEKMSAQGITHIITTPHFQASTAKQPAEFDVQMKKIDAGWEILAEAVRKKFPQIKFDRGVELALDDPDPVAKDSRLRLAATRFVLVEFPWFNIPANSVEPLRRLKTSGVTPIVAHPERYENIDPGFQILREWRTAGAFLQLNAASLTGGYGPRVERNAWECLSLGLVDFLSSDYHARGTCSLAGARAQVAARGGEGVLGTLAGTNGDRLLQGLDPIPVDRLRPESAWDRLKRTFRRS